MATALNFGRNTHSSSLEVHATKLRLLPGGCGGYIVAVPWFWRLLADLSAQSPGLILGHSVLEVVVLKLSFGRTYLTVLKFQCHFISSVY